MKNFLLLLNLLTAAGGAFAHVTFLAPATVAPKTPFKATLKVPHGCNGSATTALTVHIPKGIIAVKPQPKAGWTLASTHAPYGKVYDYYGKNLKEGVNTLTWKDGHLPDDQYDEFSFTAYLAEPLPAGSKLMFAVDQQCAQGKMRWISAQEDHGHHGDTGPAPVLTVTAPADNAHDHHHQTTSRLQWRLEHRGTRTPLGIQGALRRSNAFRVPEYFGTGKKYRPGRSRRRPEPSKTNRPKKWYVPTLFLIPPLWDCRANKRLRWASL